MSNLSPKDRSLIEQAARLVFGIFGFAGNEPYDLQGGGSGIIVAPGLALTARHVVDDFYKQLEGREPPSWPGRRRHEANLFQVLDPFNPEFCPKASWRVESECRACYTDLALLELNIGCPVSERLQLELSGQFFEWHLGLPPKGAVVLAIGYPKHSVAPEGGGIRVGAPFTYLTLEVTQTFPKHHSKGFYDFPGFHAATSNPIEGGFSGGPVFYDGRLCGLVAGEWDHGAYVTALGPLALMDYTLGEGDKDKHRFSDLFNNGVIAASDWPAIRDQLWKGRDEFGNPVVYFHEVGR